MDSKSENFLGSFDLNAAAAEESIRAFQQISGFRLPSGYADFLRASNGGEGFIGENYAVFWPVEDLVDLNKEYEVEEYAPGLFLFGSNGGGEAFAFDIRRTELPIVMVPFIPLDVDEAVYIASTFDEFVSALHERSDLLGA